MPGCARPGVGREERIAGSGRIVDFDPSCVHVLPHAACDHDRSCGCLREQQFGHAELEHAFLAAERLELLLVELQRCHVPQHLWVEVVVEHQRPGLRATNERLSVERQPPIPGKNGEHVGGEVCARQPAQVNPGGAADGSCVGDCPRRAGVADDHLALLAVVLDLERGRPRRWEPGDRDAECGQRRHERAAVGIGAAGDDARISAQESQPTGGVIRRASDARSAPVDRVAREIPDYRDAAHRRPTGL